MGIYYGDKIYGVKITSETKVLFERIQEEEIAKDKIRELYNQLCEKYVNEKLILFVYVECTMTYDYPPINSNIWMRYNFEDQETNG